MKIQSTPTINHLSALIRLDNLLDSLAFIEGIADKIVEDLNLKVVKKIDNKFEPIGRTLVYILSESHLAIHTWPEFNTFHIDLVSCSNTSVSDFDKVLTGILKSFKVVEYKSKSHSI